MIDDDKLISDDFADQDKSLKNLGVNNPVKSTSPTSLKVDLGIDEEEDPLKRLADLLEKKEKNEPDEYENLVFKDDDVVLGEALEEFFSNED